MTKILSKFKKGVYYDCNICTRTSLLDSSIYSCAFHYFFPIYGTTITRQHDLVYATGTVRICCRGTGKTRSACHFIRFHMVYLRSAQYSFVANLLREKNIFQNHARPFYIVQIVSAIFNNSDVAFLRLIRTGSLECRALEETFFS